MIWNWKNRYAGSSELKSNRYGSETALLNELKELGECSRKGPKVAEPCDPETGKRSSRNLSGKKENCRNWEMLQNRELQA